MSQDTRSGHVQDLMVVNGMSLSTWSTRRFTFVGFRVRDTGTPPRRKTQESIVNGVAKMDLPTTNQSNIRYANAHQSCSYQP